MHKIANKIISCALSAIMMGEVVAQNVSPFLEIPMKVSAEEIIKAADSENGSTKGVKADETSDTAADPATTGETADSEVTEEDQKPEFEDLVISDGNSMTITAPTEVGNLVIDGRYSKLLLPEKESFLTVHGNVEVKGGATLEIDKGELVCEDFTVTDGYYNSTVNMLHPNSTLTVNGNFTHNSGHLGTGNLKAGTLSVKGDFVSKGYVFDPGTDLTVILNGSEKQTVSITYSSSKFSTLEVRNTSGEGVYSDYAIPADQITGNLGQLHIGINGENGKKLTEDTVIDGDYTLAAGELDLNGFTLTINGNLIHAGGKVHFNGGTLNITGDYQLASPKINTEPPVYDQLSQGYIVMDNEADALNIDGDFVVRAKRSNKSSITAGTVTVKGNMQMNSGGDSNEFKATGTSKVVLAGEKEHTLNGNSSSFYFANLDLGNETITECSNTHVTGTLAGAGCKMDGCSVTLDNGAVVPEAFAGNIYFGNTFTMNGDIHVKGNVSTIDNYNYRSFNTGGYTLTVDGDFNLSCTLNPDNGAVVVNGNLKQSYRYANLNFNHADGSVTVKGDLTFNGQYGGISVTNGKLAVSGNCSVQNTSISVDKDGVLELNGTEAQTLTVTNTGSTLQKVVFNNTSKEGVLVVGNPLIVTPEIATGCVVKFEGGGQLGMTLEEDTELDSLYLVGGVLDLNGHKLTVKGDLIQASGKVIINGGTLDVKGNYKLASKSVVDEEETEVQSSTGYLVMTNGEDLVNVGKNFETYTTRSHSGSLTAGIMTVSGDFVQGGDSSSFTATGTHQVVFTDDTAHTVSFSSTNSRFQNVDFGTGTITPTNVSFTGTLIGDKCVFDGTINAYGSKLDVQGAFNGNMYIGGSCTLAGDVHVKGDITTLGCSTWSTYSIRTGGYTLTVDGDLKVSCYLYPDNGAVVVNGDLIQNGYYGHIDMSNADGSVTVKGNFTFDQNGYSVSVTKGRLTVGGDCSAKGSQLNVGEEGVLELNGTEKQTLTVTNASSNLQKVIFSNTSEEGVLIVGNPLIVNPRLQKAVL